jgi:hypothetical protein
VTPVRRFALQSLATLVVLIASAIFDVGSRASAAYVAAGADLISDGFAGAAPSEDSQYEPQKFDTNRERDGLPPPGHLQGGGSMAPPGSGPTSSSSPVVADLSIAEMPMSGLVIYFREPATRFDLPAFIDSILDPPRQA